MMNLKKLLEFVALFERFFKKMELSLPVEEALNQLYHLEDVPVETITQVCPVLYWELGLIYGEALTLEIKYGAQVIYTQRGDIDKDDLESLCSKLKSGDYVGVLKVKFNLDKRLLAQQLLDFPSGINATVIFQEEELVGIFSEPIVELDKRLGYNLDHMDAFLGDDASRQVILVPRLDVWVNGERLAIVGGKGVQQIESTLVPPPSGASSVEKIRSHGELNIRWIRLDPLRLIPLHFEVEINEDLTGPKAADLLDLLDWLKINLSLMYLSDSIRSNDDSLELTFIGAGGSSEVNLPESIPEEEEFREVMRSGADIWLEDCLWVYEKGRQVIDRLGTVQSVVSQSFPGPDDGSQLMDMLRTASRLHGFVREHWKAFSEGEVDKYFDKVKQISEFVTSAAKSYSEQIDALIKSLTSTMLGAVVTVVGTFVGSLLSNKFNPLILIIGLCVYSVYLAVFPGIIGLANARQHFSEMKGRIDSQFADLRNHIRLVDENRWEILKEQLKSSESRFECWFRVTLGIYAVVFGAAVVAVSFFLNYV